MCNFRSILKGTWPLIKVNPLRRISLVLIILIILPAVLYISFETATLSESEEMIREVYRQQLDAVLFSVNQYIEDYFSSWRTRVNIALSTEQTDFDRMVSDLTGVQAFFLWEDDMKPLIQRSVSGEMEKTAALIEDSLTQIKKRVRQLRDYQKAGYQKIQPMVLKTGSEESLLLLFIHNNYRGRPVFVGLILPVRFFIETVIRAKLDELAGERFILGVFHGTAQQSVLPGQSFNFTDANQTRAIWLLPEYLIGIQLAGDDIEDLAHERLYRDAVIIGIIFVLFLLGAWLILRNVQREIHLAQMKSDFVSNVSHELRTPLSLIRMYTETLEMGRLATDEKRMSYYRIIARETERLTRLINNILNFSRIESGKKTYKLENIDINQVVEKMVETYRVQIEQEGFQLHLDLGEKLAPILGDAEAISEALINLMDNAIKYSADKKEITIRTSTCAPGICLQISDRGMGIEEQHVKHIFDKFYRVPTGAVHNTKGSGLGLALVRHIIDAHDGSIDVKSQPGRGTTFSLSFPQSNKSGQTGD